MTLEDISNNHTYLKNIFQFILLSLFIIIFPDIGLINPVNICAKVDFPLPDWPSITKFLLF